jgi:hypothetical protein
METADGILPALKNKNPGIEFFFLKKLAKG